MYYVDRKHRFNCVIHQVVIYYTVAANLYLNELRTKGFC